MAELWGHGRGDRHRGTVPEPVTPPLASSTAGLDCAQIGVSPTEQTPMAAHSLRAERGQSQPLRLKPRYSRKQAVSIASSAIG